MLVGHFVGADDLSAFAFQLWHCIIKTGPTGQISVWRDLGEFL